MANEDVCVGDGEEELADKENGVSNEEVCVGDGEEALADKVNTKVIAPFKYIIVTTPLLTK